MPQQISQSLSLILFDDEVEAWRTLEEYLLKKKPIAWTQPGPKRIGARRMVRELLRLAAEHLAAEIGPTIAKKLASPPPVSEFQARRAAKQVKMKLAAAKTRGRKPAKKPAKKPDPKPTQRLVWNRPWKSRTGDTE